MANSGYKYFETLEEYYTDDNSATGITKQNTEGYIDYISPVYDTTSCPINITQDVSEPYMEITPTFKELVASSSHDETFSFVTNCTNWNATTDQTWAEVIYFNLGTLTVQLEGNYSGNTREVYITVVCDDNVVVVLLISQVAYS